MTKRNKPAVMADRTSETEMAAAVKNILSHRKDRTATFVELRELIPDRVKLTKADRQTSKTRPAEQLWQQILRNLTSHHQQDFEIVPGGLRLKLSAKAKAKAKAAKAKAKAAKVQPAEPIEQPAA